jgi:hypothetical protein
MNTFFALVFLQIFQLIQNQHQTLRCYTQISFLKSRLYKYFLKTLKSNADETAQKKRKKLFFYKCVIELNFATMTAWENQVI